MRNQVELIETFDPFSRENQIFQMNFFNVVRRIRAAKFRTGRGMFAKVIFDPDLS